MSSLSSFFNWGNLNQGAQDQSEMPSIFPLNVSKDLFVKTDIINIYSKILTDVCERVHGLSEEQTQLLWDNCLKSESGDGLITLLAKAMTDKADLFIVYEKALKLIRRAAGIETQQIKSDYLKQGYSTAGIYISFKNYSRSDMVKLYAALEYSTVAGLNKSLNLSSGIQFKMNDLRASTSLNNSGEVKQQAADLAKALGDGKDVYLDAKDMIVTSSPDVSSVQESIKFINQKRSFYLGLPESYINGEQTGGIGSSGENDTRAVERGLKSYYFSIIKPALEVLFGGSYSYKSQDFRQILGSMEVIKTFSLVDEELVSRQNKTMIINRLLDLPDNAKGDPVFTAPPVAPIINQSTTAQGNA
jgi:hypothetical protein